MNQVIAQARSLIDAYKAGRNVQPELVQLETTLRDHAMFSQTYAPWIHVEDGMPPPDTPVLAFNGQWIGVAAHMSDPYLEDVERWQDEQREFIELFGPKVTHWAPLPAPPKSAQSRPT